ncbi:glycosyltransferase family 4 protein [Ruegeria sediminis]|uniref:Glycosyltransferase family 4 protein n=1 Tax=Ruegeria sediminis TaxID=2583820 RepID=A0ABY2WV80_9RHOB|nr:glycosyltransferase [Ruegeria sediminis]TMV05605.1 glycosyltransferase family 4 protein [Ruegeria sediminis]
MHILHLVTRLLRAGSEENTVATCRWQARAGHRVTLLHGADFDRGWYDDPSPGLKLVRLPSLVHPLDPLSDWRALTALRRLYRDLRPDVIHTHQSKAGILGRWAAEGAPWALVVHGIHIVPFHGVDAARRALYLAAERRAAPRTDLFMAVSKAVGSAYVDAGIARPDQVHCVRSGMDLDRFRNAAWPADWRALLGLRPGEAKPPVAVMLAAFEPRKRHLQFLRSFARVARGDMRLLLAGHGPLLEPVRAEVRALGLHGRVILCGHRPDPEALLALADLSVLASEREGLPRVVVQSLAVGRPVAVNDLPGIDELVRDGVNGAVLPPGDLDGLAARTAALLTDRPALDRLRQGARGTDISDWTLETLGRRTTELYDLPSARRAA